MKYLSIIAILVSFYSQAEFKTLNLSTRLNINNLYVDSIQSVKFEPSELEIKVSADKASFESTTTKLIIETDIPESVSGVTYTSTLNKNSTTCKDYAGIEVEQTDFVSVSLDDEPMSVGESRSLLDFNNSNGTIQNSEHLVSLDFKSFDEIATTGQPESCKGEISFNIEVDI